LGRIERTAEGFLAKLPHEAGAAGEGRLARNQAVRITAAKRRLGQLLGRGAIAFDQQRRKTLTLGLIAEAVDEILWWELARRSRLVTQQIANRVIVLAVREASQFRVR